MGVELIVPVGKRKWWFFPGIENFSIWDMLLVYLIS